VIAEQHRRPLLPRRHPLRRGAWRRQHHLEGRRFVRSRLAPFAPFTGSPGAANGVWLAGGADVIRNSLGLLGINAFWQETLIGGANGA